MISDGIIKIYIHTSIGFIVQYVYRLTGRLGILL